ncbi:MAG: hypothetical protein IJU01_04905 [Lachnospiraceae bacterium]|nr:hypothetical protein [Lachnospiraceae bacterium]
MNKLRILLNKRPAVGLSNSSIKVLAAFFMLLDHAGIMLFSDKPEIYWPLRIAGRVSFPMFAFLAAEGIFYSRNRALYAMRLLLFAFITEIPYNMAIWNRFFAFGNCNVLFTLFFAVAPFAIKDLIKNKKISTAAFIVSMPVFCLTAVIFGADYDFRGVLIVWLFYFLREIRLASFAAVGIFALFVWFGNVQMYSVLALPVLALTDGRKGWIKKPWQKMIFYAFYPAHFVLLHFAGLLW